MSGGDWILAPSFLRINTKKRMFINMVLHNVDKRDEAQRIKIFSFGRMGVTLNARRHAHLERDYKNPRNIEIVARLPITDKVLKNAFDNPEAFPPALAYLLSRNQIEARRSGVKETGYSREMPVKVVLIFCCDSRSDPRVYMKSQVFKDRIAVLRIAGNLAADDVLGSLDMFKYRSERKGVEPPIVIMFGHTTCGLVKEAHKLVTIGQEPPSGDIGHLIRSAHVNQGETIQEAERTNLLHQAEMINSTIGLHVDAFMTNVTTAKLTLERTFPVDSPASASLAKKVVELINTQNSELRDDLEARANVTVHNHTQRADMVKISDARSGYLAQSVPQSIFESSIHGKIDLSRPSIGSVQYKLEHVDGHNLVVLDSHYPDVMADRLDQLDNAGLLKPENHVYALLIKHGLYEPVVLRERDTGKVYGASLLDAMSRIELG